MIISCGIIIFGGLLARDYMGFSINKYLFLFTAALPIILVDIKCVIAFSYYIIPLYVGLPGNYISLIIFARLLYEVLNKNITLSTSGFVLSMIISCYIIIQNSITGYISIYNMMTGFDFVILYMLLSATNQYKQEQNAIIAFSIGNVVLGFIMLSSTMRFFSIAELMNPATRLGYSGMLYEKARTGMITTIDPNFYAMNVIASISSGSLLISHKNSKKRNIIILSAIIGNMILCLIGLSRTFILLLLIWGLLYIAGQRNIKKACVFIVMGGLLISGVLYFMPTVVNGILSRFEDADVSGGNGRIYLILKYYEPWFENSLSILFGIGLFNCRTHCTPLLYLFGLGIVGFIPLLGWFGHNWNMFKKEIGQKQFKNYIPIIVTFISYATIPAAGTMNYTIPVLVSMLALGALDSKKDNMHRDSYMRMAL